MATLERRKQTTARLSPPSPKAKKARERPMLPELGKRVQTRSPFVASGESLQSLPAPRIPR